MYLLDSGPKECISIPQPMSSSLFGLHHVSQGWKACLMHIDWAVNRLLISQTVHGSMTSHLFLTHAKLQSSSLNSATEPGLLYQWQQDLVPFRHGSHRRFADTFRLGHDSKFPKRHGAACSARGHGIISHPGFHGSHSCRAGLSDPP